MAARSRLPQVGPGRASTAWPCLSPGPSEACGSRGVCPGVCLREESRGGVLRGQGSPGNQDRPPEAPPLSETPA